MSYYSSFIQRPFKLVYSGVLPAQPRLNNVVFRPERNRAEWATGVKRSAIGRPFQAFGPATEKALWCRITVRVRETSNCACAEGVGVKKVFHSINRSRIDKKFVL